MNLHMTRDMPHCHLLFHYLLNETKLIYYSTHQTFNIYSMCVKADSHYLQTVFKIMQDNIIQQQQFYGCFIRVLQVSRNQKTIRHTTPTITLSPLISLLQLRRMNAPSLFIFTFFASPSTASFQILFVYLLGCLT